MDWEADEFEWKDFLFVGNIYGNPGESGVRHKERIQE